MDHRDVAAATRQWWKKNSINERAMTLIVVIDDGDVEEEFTVPFCYETCGTCRGRGKHVSPSIDSQGISAEEFDQDPDFFADYRRGVYDVPCLLCGGQRVVPVPDESGSWDNPELLERVRDHISWLAQDARDRVHEAEMGY